MKKILKRLAYVVLGLIVILLLVGSVFFVKGKSAAAQLYSVHTPTTAAVTDSASLALGASLVNKLGCTDCHTPQLSGKVMIDAPPFFVVASNLTSGEGGVGKQYSAIDFDRAIRQGVRPNGSSLMIMPSRAYNELADDEAAAIIGYIKSLAPVDNELPKSQLRPLGIVLTGAGAFDPAFEVTEAAPALKNAPAPAATVEFGEYKAAICRYCHQANLEGGVAMGPGPVPPNIKPYGTLPLDVFIKTIRTGESPAGRKFDDEAMPTKIFETWTDQELEAVQLYIASLE